MKRGFGLLIILIFLGCGNESNNNNQPAPAPAPTVAPQTNVSWKEINHNRITDMVVEGQCNNPIRFTVHSNGHYIQPCGEHPQVQATGNLSNEEFLELNRLTEAVLNSDLSRHCHDSGAITENKLEVTTSSDKIFRLFEVNLSTRKICYRADKAQVDNLLELVSQLEEKYKPSP